MDRQSEFISAFTRWAGKQNSILGAALVGSVARRTARPDSDIDLILIADVHRKFLEWNDWIDEFGKPSRSAVEDYGLVQSIRAFYEDGLEVEFGITTREWLTTG